MQISPAKKQKLKANLGKTGSGKASFEDLHPRYPAGHPQGGKFMPKGGNDYVKAVAKNTGRTPQEVKASLGGDSKAKPSQAQSTPQAKPAPQGKRDYKDVLPPEAVKELQNTALALATAAKAQDIAEQAKLNAGKGTKREASKALTAAKKEVSAKQKAVEAVLIKNGASKEKAKQIAEKLIAQKVGQIKGDAKPVEKPNTEKAKTKQVAPSAKPPIAAPVVEKKTEAIAPKVDPTKMAKASKEKAIDFHQGKSLGVGIAADGSDETSDPKKKKTFKNLDKAADKISQVTGMSKEESRKAAHAIIGFSLLEYGEVRANERNGKPFTGGSEQSVPSFAESKDYDRIKAINNFIDKAPKYEGTVHRGLAFSNQKDFNKFLKSIKSGEPVDAMSSTTSNLDIAKGFASSGSINVLMNIKNKSGVSIKTLSKFSDEDEVLVPRGALYKASKITKSIGENGKELYTIDVDEIDHENQQARRDGRKK